MFAIRFYCETYCFCPPEHPCPLFSRSEVPDRQPRYIGKEPLRRLIEFEQNLGGRIEDVEAEFVNFFFPDVTKVVLVEARMG